MKRITFKKPLNGFANTLKLIPESYKVEGLEFQMTDTNETYNIKWSNGKPKITEAHDKKVIKEDFQAIKDLMTWRSGDKVIKEGEVMSENDRFLKSIKECMKPKITEGEEGEGKSGSDVMLSPNDEIALKDLLKSKLGNIKDSDIHTFAEKRGLKVPNIEAFIYKIAADSLK